MEDSVSQESGWDPGKRSKGKGALRGGGTRGIGGYTVVAIAWFCWGSGTRRGRRAPRRPAGDEQEWGWG